MTPDAPPPPADGPGAEGFIAVGGSRIEQGEANPDPRQGPRLGPTSWRQVLGKPPDMVGRRALLDVDEVEQVFGALQRLADGSAWPLLKRSGISPGNLAHLLGVTPASISHWRTGRRRPGLDVLLRLGRLFEELSAQAFYRDVVAGRSTLNLNEENDR